MKAAGLKVTEMAKELGLNRRRLDRWLRLDALPDRNRMQPRPGMPEAFREHLRDRWEAGCRRGRTLFAEVRELGYVGCFSRLAALLSPWRQPSAEVATLLPQIPLWLRRSLRQDAEFHRKWRQHYWVRSAPN
jgi:transposase